MGTAASSRFWRRPRPTTGWRRVTRAAVSSLPTNWGTACCIPTNSCAWPRCPKMQQAALHRGGQEVEHEAYQDTEWQANAFAGALLMPARGLLILDQEHGELSTALVTEHFRVSAEAAGYRLELYNNRKKELLLPQPPGWAMRPAVQPPPASS